MRQHKCHILFYRDVTAFPVAPSVRGGLAQLRAQGYWAPPRPALAGSCGDRGHYQLPRKTSLAAKLCSA